MTNRFLLIRGYRSTSLIYEKTVPLNCFSERQIELLLKTLCAKAGLSNDEIVNACASRRSGIYTGQLEVLKDNLRCQFTCGTDPCFTAAPIDGSHVI